MAYDPFGGVIPTFSPVPAPSPLDPSPVASQPTPPVSAPPPAPSQDYGYAEPNSAIGPMGDMVSEIGNRLMQDYQLTANQAAGILGNFAVEAAAFSTLQQGGTQAPYGGWGWAQWTDRRRRQFEAYAAAYGLDPSSFAANYGYLTRDPEFPAAIDAVRATTTPEEASTAFHDAFERAPNPNLPRRANYADQFAVQLSQQQPGPVFGPKDYPIPDANTLFVQQSLSQLGYPVAVDGVWGPQTDAAIRSYQEQAGLAPEGLNPVTYDSLVGATATNPDYAQPAALGGSMLPVTGPGEITSQDIPPLPDAPPAPPPAPAPFTSGMGVAPPMEDMYAPPTPVAPTSASIPAPPPAVAPPQSLPPVASPAPAPQPMPMMEAQASVPPPAPIAPVAPPAPQYGVEDNAAIPGAMAMSAPSTPPMSTGSLSPPMAPITGASAQAAPSMPPEATGAPLQPSYTIGGVDAQPSPAMPPEASGTLPPPALEGSPPFNAPFDPQMAAAGMPTATLPNPPPAVTPPVSSLPPAPAPAAPAPSPMPTGAPMPVSPPPMPKPAPAPPPAPALPTVAAPSPSIPTVQPPAPAPQPASLAAAPVPPQPTPHHGMKSPFGKQDIIPGIVGGALLGPAGLVLGPLMARGVGSAINAGQQGFSMPGMPSFGAGGPITVSKVGAGLYQTSAGNIVDVSGDPGQVALQPGGKEALAAAGQESLYDSGLYGNSNSNTPSADAAAAAGMGGLW